MAPFCLLLNQDVNGDVIAVLIFELGGCHSEPSDHSLGIDEVACDNGPDRIANVEYVGDRFGHDEFILNMSRRNPTSTFFWVQTTTESVPLIATVVMPSFLTALNEFSLR